MPSRLIHETAVTPVYDWHRHAATLKFMFAIAMFLLALPVVAQTARASSSLSGPPLRSGYVGDEACRSCHTEEVKNYETTAHHFTSRTADAQSIAGTFNAGANLFKTANPSLYFKMTADKDGFHQTAVDEVSPGKKCRTV